MYLKTISPDVPHALIRELEQEDQRRKLQDKYNT
jgi:hypothetical protein